MPVQRAKLLRVHFSEADQYQGRPLLEAILDKCRELGIAGVSAFRGLEGYGETAEIHRHQLMHHDQPVVIIVIDHPEPLAKLIPAIEDMMDTGLIAMSDVMVTRVRKSAVRTGG